uniref:Uncharacterized protein n=1 Tax=Lepeophtheirus salmonis TaxID=72036 RepID=A0A0K2UQB9_LEPSM
MSLDGFNSFHGDDFGVPTNSMVFLFQFLAFNFSKGVHGGMLLIPESIVIFQLFILSRIPSCASGLLLLSET